MRASHEPQRPGYWHCSVCGCKLRVANICPRCHALLCDACTDAPHEVPAGLKTGLPCESADAAEADAA